MDRLLGMHVLVKAVELGSFTAAGAALGLSPQMVGKHVASLEARLGTTLLNRTTRRQSLTASGEVFYARCRAVLADAEAAEEDVRALGAAPRGRLRVNAPVTFGSFRLAPLVARFVAEHPEVEVELILSDRFVDIVAEGFDVVLRIGTLPDSTLVARPLAPYRLLAWASPAYLARRGVPEEPEALSAHDCLRFVAASGFAVETWSFTAPGRARTIRPGGRTRVNDARVLRDLAVSGHGVIMQASSVVADDVATGRLVRVLPGWAGPVRPVHLVFPAARSPTPKLRRFVELVAGALGPEPAAR